MIPLLVTMTNAGFDWEEALHQAQRRGYVAALRWLGSRDESRDACQDAVLRAVAQKSRYDSGRPFYPWFYRILKNVCLDRLGRRKRAAQAVDELRFASFSGDSRDAENRAWGNELQRAVSQAVDSLPPDQREVIELRHFQDLNYKEIAEILDCPVGTVMSRLYRARRSLRQKLVSVGWDLGGGR